MTKLPKIYNRYRRLNNMYKITDKNAKSVVFKMNKAQLEFYNVEKQYHRIIVLKARQLGMTTYKCMSGLDRCLFYSNQNIVITAHKQEKQKEIFQKVKYAFEQIPDAIRLGDGTVRKKPVPKYDSVNELYFPHNNSRIKVSLDSRSGTPTSIHITELAFRPDARDMMTGTLPSVPKNAPITIETTANGVGNYFYELRKKSEDTQMFYPFFIPRYTDANYVSDSDYKGLTTELSHLSKEDLTEKQKQRYIERYAELGREVFQEYPTNPEEAFLATGDCVFNTKKIKNMKVLQYVEDSKYNRLRIYKKSTGYCYYGVDTAGGSIDGDYSTISVRNANLELLASYKGHMTPDGLCDVIDHLWKIGYTGLIGIERNNTGLTTITKAKEYIRYSSLYTEKTIDKITNKKTKKYGWITTSTSRPILINDYEEAIRKEDITELDERTKKECYTFYYNEKNKPEAINGSHDDTIIADSICLQMTKKGQYIAIV